MFYSCVFINYATSLIPYMPCIDIVYLIVGLTMGMEHVY